MVLKFWSTKFFIISGLAFCQYFYFYNILILHSKSIISIFIKIFTCSWLTVTNIIHGNKDAVDTSNEWRFMHCSYINQTMLIIIIIRCNFHGSMMHILYFRIGHLIFKEEFALTLIFFKTNVFFVFAKHVVGEILLFQIWLLRFRWF